MKRGFTTEARRGEGEEENVDPATVHPGKKDSARAKQVENLGGASRDNGHRWMPTSSASGTLAFGTPACLPAAAGLIGAIKTIPLDKLDPESLKYTYDNRC